MHLLVLGYSSIVRRRVLPAARSVRGFHRISVASRHRGCADVEDDVRDVMWYSDYDEALASSGADVAYVSGVNSLHGEWVARALGRGFHVIVDKPACLDLESAERLVALARHRGRALAEATVFAFHPQVATLQSLMQRADGGSMRATMTFSVPPLPSQDFRYRADCGGGSLYDQGPYVVATSRLLFGSPPSKVYCAVLSTQGSPNVDTSFTVLLTHENGGALAGHCGFVTAYQNRLSILTQSRAIEAMRIFSTPPDLVSTLKVSEAGLDRTVSVPAADSFALFLQTFCDAVDRRDLETFHPALIEDARLMARLRHAAGRP